MFSPKHILFHAMKQIANVCYFIIMAARTPSTPLRLCQYFYEKKKSSLFMYLFSFCDCFS